MSEAELDENTFEVLGPRKPAKALPEGVHPRSAYWYTKSEGIEGLNSDELIVLDAEYNNWAVRNHKESKTFDKASYCRFRQRQHALRSARRFSQTPTS